MSESQDTGEEMVDEVNLRKNFKFDTTKDVNVLDKKVGKLDKKVRGLEEQVDELGKEIIRDKLTGAYNRGFLDRKLLELTKGPELKPFGFVMVDIDSFKKLNDTYGHQAGDTVLREVVNSLFGVIRDGDLLCRYGGEEFVVLMPGLPDVELREKANDLRRACRQEYAISNEDRSQRVPVTVSIGAVHFDPTNDMNLEDLIKKADQALYHSKETGRDRVTVAE